MQPLSRREKLTAVESYATILFALTWRAAVRPGEWT
jgi:hypothetical protein